MRDISPEQLATYQVLEAATGDACDRMEDAGVDVLNTKPTTLAGIIALCRYVEPLFNEQHAFDLPEVISWEDDTQSTPAGGFANVIAAAVKALLGKAA